MALKPLPLEPVEAHLLDDPRRGTREPLEPAPSSPPPAARDAARPPSPKSPGRQGARRARRPAASKVEGAGSAATAASHPINPYARAGRPHQVAVSLYVPQWERIEEQCVELRGLGVRDATVTRWLFAVLQLKAPTDREEAGDLLRRWARMEADEESYFGLRKEARGIRFFEDLWERQRTVVAALRQGAGQGRPTLATWTSAVVELCGPKSAEEARVLLRELRQLLAGDPG